MGYVKGVLSGTAAVMLALFGPGLVSALRGFGREKATGLAAVAGGLTEALFSPIFWGAVFLFFALLWATSRLSNKILRVILFWMPTVFITTIGFTIFVFLAYAFLHFRRS